MLIGLDAKYFTKSYNLINNMEYVCQITIDNKATI